MRARGKRDRPFRVQGLAGGLIGRMPKPWVKLNREEGGAFAQLPLLCRGLAAELVKVADDGGWIDLGGRPAADAICWRLGATSSDRRLVRKFIPLLEAAGFIVQGGDRLDVDVLLVELCGAEPMREPDTSGARPSNEPSTTDQRTGNEPTTNPERTDHEIGAKLPKSRDGTKGAPEDRREEERRKEKNGRARGREGLRLVLRWAADSGLDELSIPDVSKFAGKRVQASCERLGVEWVEVYERWRSDKWHSSRRLGLRSLETNLQKYIKPPELAAGEGDDGTLARVRLRQRRDALKLDLSLDPGNAKATEELAQVERDLGLQPRGQA